MFNTMNFCNAAGALALALALPAHAVNKCTGPDGRVAYQDSPCSSDAKSNQPVKTWAPSGMGTGQGASRSVEPNLKLTGPAQAKPLLDVYRRWADADKLARSTGRIALAVPVASLQALQREAEALVVPECLFPASKALTALISKSTEAIIQFMGKQELSNMVYEIVDKPKLIPEFESAVSTARCDEKR